MFILEGHQFADGPKCKASWSIIICAPSGFFGEIWETGGFRPRGGPIELTLTSNRGYVGYHEAVLQMLSTLLPIIVGKWRAMWKELNDLIESDGYTTFMKPEEYVHLLYDEASFPRSRFYFWAIGCLSAFEENLTTNIRQLHAFRKSHTHPNRVHQSTPETRRLGTSLDPVFQDLEDVAEQLRKKLAALQALRDGVCTQTSASFLRGS
jgi:hypothetical protein